MFRFIPILVAIAGLGFASSGHASTLILERVDTSPVNVGDEIELVLRAENFDPFTLGQLDIEFDDTLFDFVSFVRMTGVFGLGSGVIDTDPITGLARIRNVAVSAIPPDVFDPALTLLGNFVIGTFTFTATEVGLAEFSVLPDSFGDGFVTFIPPTAFFADDYQGLAVNILDDDAMNPNDPSAIPVPGAAILFAAGGAVFAAAKRRTRR